MWPYWLMFLVPAWSALSSMDGPVMGAIRRPRGFEISWALLWVVVTLLVGFREEVGGDWGNYFDYLFKVTGRGIVDVLSEPEPGYLLLNWISVQMDWGIYGVNVICGALFATGLVALCRRQPLPWLALAVAVPYLLIVVAMGYSRQGVALGLAMLGVVALGDGSTVRFVVLTTLAATFHKSAVLLLPIAALAAARNRYWTLLWVGLVAVVAYKLMLENDVENLYTNYVQAEYQSSGTLPRLLMNGLPAAAFFVWRSRFRFTESDARLWTWFSILSFVLLGLFLVSPSTTAVDRIALYLLPLQLVVFSHLPLALNETKSPEAITNGAVSVQPTLNRKNVMTTVAAILAYYAVALFVWLNFGANSFGWIPYQLFFLRADSPYS
jgi:predicted secreted protein